MCESVFCKHFVVVVFHCRSRCSSGALIPVKRAEPQVRDKLLLLSPVNTAQTQDYMNQLFHSITLSGPAEAATVRYQFNGQLLSILANTHVDSAFVVPSFHQHFPEDAENYLGENCGCRYTQPDFFRAEKSYLSLTFTCEYHEWPRISVFYWCFITRAENVSNPVHAVSEHRCRHVTNVNLQDRQIRYYQKNRS